MSREPFRTVLIVGALAASAIAFPFLPGSLPPAFGVPPGWEQWVGRAISAFFLPGAALVVCVLVARLAAADPLRGNYERFRATYNLAVNAGVAFIIGLHATLLATLLLGARPWIGYAPPLLVGCLVLAVGNALPRVRPNSVVGISTAWARHDERVWRATHRAGGYVLVAFGLLIVASTFIARRWLAWIVGAGAGTTALLLVAVSYLAWRAARGRHDPSSDPSLPLRG